MGKWERLLARIERNCFVNAVSDCWIWQGSKNKGYGRLTLRVRGKNVRYYAHRVAWSSFHRRNVPRGRVVAHSVKCISPLCCNPQHLRATTQSQNERDKKRTARWRERCLREEALGYPGLRVN